MTSNADTLSHVRVRAVRGLISSNRNSADIGMTPDGRDIKLSRVSILREMFQTGIIRPIEEFDELGTPPFPEFEKQPSRNLDFLRTLPGSPHLGALRNNKNQTASPLTESTSVSSVPTPPQSSFRVEVKRKVCVCNDRDRPATTTKTPSLPLATTSNKEMTPSLKESIALFEIGAPTQYSKTSTVFETDVQPNTVKRAQSIFENARTDSPTSVTRTSVSNLSGPSSVTVSAVSSSPTLIKLAPEQEPRITNVLQSSPSKSSSYAMGSNQAPVTAYKKDIYQPDSYRQLDMTPTESPQMDASLSGLYHAQPIAVATPDPQNSEADGDVDQQMSDSLSISDYIDRPGSPVPTLPLPSGLKLSAVDSMGVHILEDGNFFYTIPGLSSRSESPNLESSTLVDSSLTNRSVNYDAELLYSPWNTSTNKGSPDSDTVVGGKNSELPLPDSSSDCVRKCVRFSTDPILVFSTHSMTEYNRRNDDIDPLSASAEYELEKQLEEMEFIEVDIKKSDQGLGISILGLGVDNAFGEQKLGIFIKAVVPGGAAETCGQIHPFDQIVEVNGTNLVGVSQIFAAQTLRNTGEYIHFVLAREQDPSQSRVAKMLAEHEEESDPNPPASKETASPSAPYTFTREDSMETLQKHLAGTAYPFTVAADDDERATTTSRFSPVLPSGSPFSPPTTPRSALKGTATAASTKRRQDAIDQLIQLGFKRVGGESHSLPADQNSALFVMASDLYDCHCQLIKLQTQVSSLEQQLTSQEAAADETIERLCLQCHHMQLELVDSQQRFKDYMHNSSGSPHAIKNTSPVDSTMMPQSNGVNKNDVCQLATMVDVNQMAEIPCSQDSLHDNGLNGFIHHQTVDQRFTQRLDPLAAGGNTSLLSIHERKRLLASSGLTFRRPPSKFTINPPPMFVPGTEGFLDRFISQFSPPRLPNNHHSSHLTNSSFIYSSNADSPDSVDGSMRRDSTDLICVGHLQPSHKRLGVLLPGLAEVASQPFVFNRLSTDTSPVSPNLSLGPRPATNTT